MEDLALLNPMFDVMNFTAKPPSSANLKERSPYVTELPESTNNKRNVFIKWPHADVLKKY